MGKIPQKGRDRVKGRWDVYKVLKGFSDENEFRIRVLDVDPVGFNS